MYPLSKSDWNPEAGHIIQEKTGELYFLVRAKYNKNAFYVCTADCTYYRGVENNAFTKEQLRRQFVCIGKLPSLSKVLKLYDRDSSKT